MLVRARIACAHGGGSAVAVPIQVVSPTSPPALSKVLQARGAPPNALRDASGVLWLRGCPFDPPPQPRPCEGPSQGPGEFSNYSAHADEHAPFMAWQTVRQHMYPV